MPDINAIFGANNPKLFFFFLLFLTPNYNFLLESKHSYGSSSVAGVAILWAVEIQDSIGQMKLEFKA